MKIVREVKISDDNYGNSTHKLEFHIAAADAPAVQTLLDTWESLLRNRPTLLDEDHATVKQMREFEAVDERLREVISRIAEHEAPHMET
jgi:GTPase Era involved in 16S rRNA processing